jgi:hypothetical protein
VSLAQLLNIRQQPNTPPHQEGWPSLLQSVQRAQLTPGCPEATSPGWELFPAFQSSSVAGSSWASDSAVLVYISGRAGLSRLWVWLHQPMWGAPAASLPSAKPWGLAAFTLLGHRVRCLPQSASLSSGIGGTIRDASSYLNHVLGQAVGALDCQPQSPCPVPRSLPPRAHSSLARLKGYPCSFQVSLQHGAREMGPNGAQKAGREVDLGRAFRWGVQEGELQLNGAGRHKTISSRPRQTSHRMSQP